MGESNFIDNVLHDNSTRIIEQPIILNSHIIADMAASSPAQYKHIISTYEISIDAGYTIKLDKGQKMLYRDGIKCDTSTTPESVISDIRRAWGTTITWSIGITVSENYGLHMSPEKSLQFYQRI